MRTKWISFVTGVVLTLGSSCVIADHTETVVGAAVGSAAGAALGGRTGGRNDVVIWSAIGGATGAVVGRSLGAPHERQIVVQEKIRYIVEDDVVVHRPIHVRHVYYEDRPRYYRAKHHFNGRHHDRHHGRGRDDD